MKAYVIKNKVHGYFGVNNMYQYPEWSSIDLAYYFKTEEEAEKFKNKNYPTCKVVEITIAEGDLEEENKVLKKAYLSACKKLSEVFGECPYSNMNLQMPDYCDEECINNEKYLCWDKYFINQAKKEK